MGQIEPKLHLLTVTILCLAALTLLLILRKRIKVKRGQLFYISTLIFVLIYLYIVGTALLEDMYCQWDVNKYDLNQDGIFTPNEIDSYQEAAMKRLTNDTGRNLSVITGLIFSFIVSSMVYGTVWTYRKIRT
jgi:hypothetical protein